MFCPIDACITNVGRDYLNQLATVRQGAFLPHWTLDGAIYHTVFRLADSLPANVVDEYRRERAALLAEAGESSSPAARQRLSELFSVRVECYLDAGRGACWLGRSEIAELTSAAVRHFDGSRYELHAWAVMPNHVHVVLRPFSSHALEDILHSWKSFTATRANKIIGRTGPFWQKESYDHIVRDADDLQRTVKYVQENSSKAGLQNWAWVWPT